MPPPVLQRPFQRNRPLFHSKSDVRYARLFMISSGGRGMTKFLFTHIFKERIKNNMQQSNGFRRQPPVLWCPFQRIRPLPHSMSDIGYARLFMISMGRRDMTKFFSTYVFKGRKINYATIRIQKHLTINLLVGFIYMWFDGGFPTRMMNVTK